MNNSTPPYKITSKILKLSTQISEELTKLQFTGVEKVKLIVDSIKTSISALKEYVSYTFANTPFPPLKNVPKRGSSL